jgi:hypothetical protein
MKPARYTFSKEAIITKGRELGRLANMLDGYSVSERDNILMHTTVK